MLRSLRCKTAEAITCDGLRLLHGLFRLQQLQLLEVAMIGVECDRCA